MIAGRPQKLWRNREWLGSKKTRDRGGYRRVPMLLAKRDFHLPASHAPSRDVRVMPCAITQELQQPARSPVEPGVPWSIPDDLRPSRCSHSCRRRLPCQNWQHGQSGRMDSPTKPDAGSPAVAGSSLEAAVMQEASKRTRREIVSVQYLRGLAVLLVVIFHLSSQISDTKGMPQLAALQSGVDIFFVISGFVMVYSTDAGSRTTALDFFRKRIIRIVPLYWTMTLVMILVLLVAPQLVRSTKLTPVYAIASFAFIGHESPVFHGNYLPLIGPGWTLNLEMLFYLCFTVGLVIGRSGPKVLWLTALPIAVLSAVGFYLRPVGLIGFYTNPLMLEFVFGMFIALGFMRNQALESPKAAAFVTVFALLLLLLPPSGELFDRWFRFGVPAALLVGAALYTKVPSWSVGRIIGDASYSIYLSHPFVLSALSQIWKKVGLTGTAEAATLYPIGLLICIMVGIACWKFVELPLTRLAQRAAYGRVRS